MGESKPQAVPGRARGHGQTIILITVALPVLAGAIGLAMDIGNLYLNYFRLQTADDASVLSGAMYLPDQPSRAISTADNYASINGVGSGEIVSTTTSYDSTLCPAPPSPPSPPVPGCKLTMALQRTVPYYFARLVGINSGTVNVLATAAAQAAGTIKPGTGANRGPVQTGRRDAQH